MQVTYNNCSKIFNDLGFSHTDAEIYSTGVVVMEFTRGETLIQFYKDGVSNDCEFTIGTEEREVVYIGKLSSVEFLEELLKNIDYEYNI